MIYFPILALTKNKIPATVVLGYQANEVQSEITEFGFDNISFIEQTTQKGTAHAVLTAQPSWKSADHVLVLNGDTPLVTDEIIKKLVDQHIADNATVSFVQTSVINPSGYGRIIKDGDLIKNIEEKDCTPAQRKIQSINAGIYIFNRVFLEKHLNELSSNNANNEFYLPDLIGVASQLGLTVVVMQEPFDKVRGVNTLEELWAVEQIKRSELMKHWMARGVRFELAQNIHLDVDVTIGQDCFIGNGVLLLRGTTIGQGCVINAFTIIGNSTIGRDTLIRSHTVVQDSTIGDNCIVGPFARIKGMSIIKDDVKIGSFTEISESIVENYAGTTTLSYLSNTQVLMNEKVSAGTIQEQDDDFSLTKKTISLTNKDKTHQL